MSDIDTEAYANFVDVEVAAMGGTAIDDTTRSARDDLKRQLIEALIVGHSIRQACETAGICRRTFYLWRDADPEFAEAIAQAQRRKRAAPAESRHNGRAQRTGRSTAPIAPQQIPPRQYAVRVVLQNRRTTFGRYISLRAAYCERAKLAALGCER